MTLLKVLLSYSEKSKQQRMVQINCIFTITCKTVKDNFKTIHFDDFASLLVSCGLNKLRKRQIQNPCCFLMVFFPKCLGTIAKINCASRRRLISAPHWSQSSGEKNFSTCDLKSGITCNFVIQVISALAGILIPFFLELFLLANIDTSSNIVRRPWD